MSIEEQASDLRIRLKADFIKTMRQEGGRLSFISGPLIDGLVEDAMFHIENLLIQLAESEQHHAVDD